MHGLSVHIPTQMVHISHFMLLNVNILPSNVNHAIWVCNRNPNPNPKTWEPQALVDTLETSEC